VICIPEGGAFIHLRERQHRDPGLPTDQPETPSPVAGMLLTGGASRRMGIDKASIVIAAGRTCAEVVAGRLAAVAAPVIEVGPGRSGLTSIADQTPGAGPLAAMATGWMTLHEMGHAGAVLVLACDLPSITVPVLDLLARFPGVETVVPVVRGRAQPLCARFSARSLDTCQRLVAEGLRSLNATTVTWIGPEIWSAAADDRCFRDIDTPEDLTRMLESNPNRVERHEQ
jgi:molybdopterin-guanine dinucleotide biosynthesis protein A